MTLMTDALQPVATTATPPARPAVWDQIQALVGTDRFSKKDWKRSNKRFGGDAVLDYIRGNVKVSDLNKKVDRKLRRNPSMNDYFNPKPVEPPAPPPEPPPEPPKPVEPPPEPFDIRDYMQTGSGSGVPPVQKYQIDTSTPIYNAWASGGKVSFQPWQPPADGGGGSGSGGGGGGGSGSGGGGGGGGGGGHYDDGDWGNIRPVDWRPFWNQSDSDRTQSLLEHTQLSGGSPNLSGSGGFYTNAQNPAYPRSDDGFDGEFWKTRSGTRMAGSALAG